MKIFKKFLWGLLIVFTLSFVLVMGAVAYVWTHPKETWAYVQSRYLPEDLKITWDTLDIRLQRTTGWNFAFVGDIRKFHIQKENPSIDIPVDEIHWDLALAPLQDQHQVFVRDLRIKAISPMKFSAGPPEQETAEENPFEKLHGYLSWLRKSRHFKVQNFEIVAEKFIFTSFEGDSTEITARLQRSSNNAADTIDFSAEVLLPGATSPKISTSGSLNLDNFETDQPFLNATLQVLGWGVQTRQKILFQSQDKDTLIQVSGSVTYSQKKIKATVFPELEVRITPSSANLTLKANATGVPGPMVKVKNLVAHLKVPFSEGQLWSEQASKFDLSVPIELFFIDKNMRPPIEKACECKIPESLKAKFAGQVWFRQLLGNPADLTKVLEVRLELDSVRNKLLSVDLAAALDIHKKSGKYNFAPKLDSHIVLHSFKGLRNFLDAKNILVPAPFSVLDGTIDFTARGPIDSSQEVYQFPLAAKVRLASAHQQVNVNAESSVNLSTNLENLDFKVKLTILDLQLQLPPLNPVGGVPKIAPDSRILKKPKVVVSKKAKKIKMGFDFEVVTAKPGAIRLLSKYAVPYLPISMAVAAHGKEDTKGYIQAEPFKVEYLRRIVQVEKLRMDLENMEKGLLPLQGRLRVDQAGYKIYIHFDGTVQKPQISMTSDPDLNQNEIISVLLYGRTSDQLVTADAQTAGSFQAAMADRAIGIFGLWAFAATPIQSFSYNPLTKVYTATVAITDDLTAGIGTNWEESTRLELRKRVSRRWMLTASWTPTETGDVEEKLVLQWEKRF